MYNSCCSQCYGRQGTSAGGGVFYNDTSCLCHPQPVKEEFEVEIEKGTYLSEEKPKANYMQKGRTIECGRCHPDKFEDCVSIFAKYQMKCDCICHDNPQPKPEEHKGGCMCYKCGNQSPQPKECEHGVPTADSITGDGPVCGRCLKQVVNPESWEKDWDKRFFKHQEFGAIENSDEMKPFIRKLLSSQKKRLVQKIKKLKWGENCPGRKVKDCEFHQGYNKALEHIKHLLEKERI